jgi:hypothetical protein
MEENRQTVIERLRQKARSIAAKQPRPAFYRDFSGEVRASGHHFHTDVVVCRLHAQVAQAIENDFGHGMLHARKVALDAGALVAIEGRRVSFSSGHVAERIRMAQCAGLLHDIQRRCEDHARQGALYAGKCLSAYPFSETEVSEICMAIANHEAFKTPQSMDTAGGRLLSDCLYDSDKFRFGPDNFTHTVWDMLEVSDIPLGRFADRYPRGIEFLERIKQTFRTPTGRIYGPQFIDAGLAIGEELYAYMKTELEL